ncbi:MAG: site-2 protease family protein [Candidatus Bathyarchaeia archaeon]|jgi:membrane-associated protease RseP (regulator of RpoE activity)
MVPAFYFLAIYLAIWILVTIAWWAFKAERFGITGLPFYLIYRTTRLNKWIERIADSSRTAWRTIWNIGIVTGVGLMVYIFYQLGKNLLNLFIKSNEAVSIQPIVPIPGLGVTFETFPYLVLALTVVVVSHELSHGIASLVDRIPLKTTGVFFAHLLMGGFVEPDEEKLAKAKNVAKLRVFAAGSYTNAVLGILVVFLLFSFPATISPFYNVVQTGVLIGGAPDNLPAQLAGLRTGDVVSSINGTTISGIVPLRNYMNKVTPGQVVVIGTQRGEFAVRTQADPSNSTHSLIGISGLTDNTVYNPKFQFMPRSLPTILLHAEFWMSVVLVSVALINMLPMYPFDGDKFLETTLNVLGLRRTKELRMIANFAAYSLLLLNVGLSFIRFGFLRY